MDTHRDTAGPVATWTDVWTQMLMLTDMDSALSGTGSSKGTAEVLEVSFLLLSQCS